MAISTKLAYEDVDNLFLDPMNPRLGRHRMKPDTEQDELLEIMSAWVLDEIAWSYIESGGFWTHEALIAVREDLYGQDLLVAVEGNRRLAALKYLQKAHNGKPRSKKWEAMEQDSDIDSSLFERVPYLLADSRKDVNEFLGFRHVTGIKEWDSFEKAGFIATLIDEHGMSYVEVMRKIGSKTPTVRRHYIAYKALLQIEDSVEDFDAEKAEKRFALLYMTLDTQGAQQYLNTDMTGDPEKSRMPVPEDHLSHLANFSRWLFGTNEKQPLLRDTRQVSDFGKMLQSAEVVTYLENARSPNFEVAYRLAGGDEIEIIQYINDSAQNIELALGRAHFYTDSKDLQEAVKRLGKDTLQLLNDFPDIKNQFLGKS